MLMTNTTKNPITNILRLSLGIVIILIAVAIRLVLIKLGLVNNSVEHFLPLTFILIGTIIILAKHKVVKTLAVLAGLLAIAFTGFLIALMAAAPYAR